MLDGERMRIYTKQQQCKNILNEIRSKKNKEIEEERKIGIHCL